MDLCRSRGRSSPATEPGWNRYKPASVAEPWTQTSCTWPISRSNKTRTACQPTLPAHRDKLSPSKLSRQRRYYQADFDPDVCLTCPFHVEAHCPGSPGKNRPTHRLTFPPKQMAVAQRRRKMRQNKQDGKNHRAAIEGTVQQVKHPFPAGKLPVRGLFRVACLMVASAAMANVRRIHHYWEEQRKLARQKMGAEQGPNATPQHQDLSFAYFSEGIVDLPESVFRTSECLFRFLKCCYCSAITNAKN